MLWIPVLALVYALTLASFDPWDLAIGAVVGAGVLAVFWRYPLIAAEGGRRNEGNRHPSSVFRLPPSAAVWFWPFAVVVAWEIVRGTWQVALVVLGLRPHNRAGLVEMPMGDMTPLGIAVFGVATTLSPGSVLVEVDWAARMLLFHVLDASNPDEVRAEFARLYERWQRRVAP